MTHLFEDGSLTFGELRDIFTKLFQGEVLISEKTDGQALAITYKDGEFGVARNKSTLKKPMSIKELNSKFEGRGELQKAFVNSMKDLSKALSSIDEDSLNDYLALKALYFFITENHIK